MAQPLIRAFVAELAAQVELPDPVVEFGALQVEPGQDGDLRPLFAGRAFTGTDMRAGPGVDRVEDLRALSFADASIGTALCLDTLEHCEDPVAACRELARVTAPGGVCVISSVMLWGIHGYPSDYFRFTPEGFRSLLVGFDDVWVAGIGDPDIPTQVVGVGAKGRSLDLSLAGLPSLAEAQARFDRAEGLVRVGPFRMRPGEVAATLAREGARIARAKLSGGRARRAAS
jgi:SAM-dependent methyltransferase